MDCNPDFSVRDELAAEVFLRLIRKDDVELGEGGRQLLARVSYAMADSFLLIRSETVVT